MPAFTTVWGWGATSKAAWTRPSPALGVIWRVRELRVELRDRVRRTLGDVGRFSRQLEAVYREL
jgi:hypothetical protein